MIKYYTDWHNVDEDMLTISALGGNWDSFDHAGVVYRDTDESPASIIVVAPSTVKN